MDFQKKLDEKYGIGKIELISAYKNNKTKVELRCSVCGHEWSARPDNLMHSKVGCPKCACKRSHDSVKIKTEEYVARCKDLFGGLFTYEKTDLKDGRIGRKIVITCAKCGSDIVTDFQHLLRLKHVDRLCKVCNPVKKTETIDRLERFKTRLEEKFPNTYDTSETVYHGYAKPLTVKYQGNEVSFTPQAIFSRKKPILAKQITCTKDFVERAKEVHGDKYDYTKSIYVASIMPVVVTCKLHGDFTTKPYNHVHNKTGCPICGHISMIEKESFNFADFLAKAREKHGYKYEYDSSTFVNLKTKMRITCPIHGEFWQTPQTHISNKGHGCPICNESQLEREVRLFCDANAIEYIRNYKPTWLGLQTLDFYFPKRNIALECQGKQHFFIGGWNASQEDLETIVARDLKKKKLCEENNLKLVYLFTSIIRKEDVISNTLLSDIYTDADIFFGLEDLVKKCLA